MDTKVLKTRWLYAYIGVSAFVVVCMIIQMSSERPCSEEEIRTLM